MIWPTIYRLCALVCFAAAIGLAVQGRSLFEAVALGFLMAIRADVLELVPAPPAQKEGE